MTDINIISSILLVDDDLTSIFLQRYLLTDVCYFKGDIHECYNGKTALEFLESKSDDGKNGQHYPLPDLILLDINMPVMNGFEFLESYSKLPEKLKGGIVISMLTSSLNIMDMEKVDKFKTVSDFITKPLEQEALMKIIEKHFG